MKIDFFTNEVGDGWAPSDLDKFLGGNEEALVLLSEALTDLGHDVTVFTSLRHDAEVHRNGVDYRPRHAFRSAEGRDVLVCLKDRAPLFDSTLKGARVYWCLDVEQPWDTSGVDAFVTLAPYHLSRLPWLTHHNVQMIHYGYDMARHYASPERDENLALYTTSPDRGLDRLLLDWADIKEKRPDLRLVVTYRWPDMQRINDAARAYFSRLRLLLGQPDIEMRTVSQDEMLELFSRAKYWIHTLNNPDSDLVGFSALKAELGGCNLVIPGAIGGFRDAVEHYIPYREWKAGNDREAVNPLVSVRPEPWANIAKQWEIILEGAQRGRRESVQTVQQQSA